VQRRHQKVIEESPSPSVDPDLRRRMGEAALNIAREAGYHNAGTVEFLLDKDKNFYFIEVNARIQVEHTVTELVTGIDLIQWQLRIAAGEPLDFRQEDVEQRGHALECRINAEDPEKNFQPSPGLVRRFIPPGGPGVRLDSHVYQGYTIPPFYDSMIGKLLTYRRTRGEAIRTMLRALDEFVIEGPKSTIGLHKQILQHSEFLAGKHDTGFLDRYQAGSTTTVRSKEPSH
jgi:acetyl-CoA carboxylase biotin carboxylase subunit